MNETFNEAAPTLKFGTVSAVDEQTMRVRVRLPDLDNLRTDWLPVLTRKSLRDKDYWLPDIGEHVAVLLDANGDDGVVLGAIFSDADTVPVSDKDKRHVKFEDGTEIEYDRKMHQLTVKCVGEICIQAARSITIQAAEQVNIFGTQHIAIQSEGGSDTRIGVSGNAEIRSSGFAQFIALGHLLIKSDAGLTLVGPNSRIDL